MSNEIKLLAGLDIETMSRDQDAVVFQVGVAVHLFTPPSTYPVPDNEHRVFSPVTYDFGLDILTQLMQGRSVSKSTMEFHRDVARKSGFDMQDPVVRTRYFHQAENQVLTVEETRKLLSKIFSDVQEIWINHPEFDLPRLKGALGVREEEDPLFDFRKVRDIATVRGSGISIPRIDNSNEGRHDAVLDATWNLQVALAWHHRVHQINHLEESLLSATQATGVQGGVYTTQAVVASTPA